MAGREPRARHGGGLVSAAGPAELDPTAVADVDRPRVPIDGHPAAIRDLTALIDSGQIPGLYVTDGTVVHLERVSGQAPAGAEPDGDGLTPWAAAPLRPAGLASLLAHHVFVCRLRRTKSGEIYEEEFVPAERVLAAVLSGHYWPGLRPLHGIVAAPVLRPDGSLLQTPGYDPATGLFLAPRVRLAPIPDQPDGDQVAAARVFLLDRLLGDFPWTGPADRANYLALMVSNILRPFTRALTPFGLITATTQGSGKSILAEGIGLLYGQHPLPWPDGDDAELRKAITAALAQPAGVFVFDNIREGGLIRSPVLAQLLTATTWTDRRLGTSATVSAVNDRLWLATGNNLRLGGDMSTRAVLVSLDPKTARPELRTGFQIPDLPLWIRQPAHQRQILRALLILIRDWIAADAPRSHHVMRQFTPWAAAAGGFLDHHGIDGFLTNTETVREMDDDDSDWTVFLARWHHLFPGRRLTSAQLRASADPDPAPTLDGHQADRWDGRFLLDRHGRPVNPKSLGRLLAGQVGRYHDTYVLRADVDRHTKQKTWWVDHQTDPDPSGPAGR